MAITQTSADKKSAGLITQEDAGGFIYTMIGANKIYTGGGTPDHTTGQKGDLCIDTTNGKLYITTDGAGTWAECT
tara:strand:+ start:659 stop:883 length:225 start_codon:yes stop_codon:yes gene_type:complete